jgi:hypothetical protein
MNNKASLVPQSIVGWALGSATVNESGDVETEGFLTHFEKDRRDERWLMVFRTQLEAETYLVNTLPVDVLESCRWTCAEFTALDLLGFLREFPDIEGVLFDPGSDRNNYVPADVLIDVVERNLVESEGDTA